MDILSTIFLSMLIFLTHHAFFARNNNRIGARSSEMLNSEQDAVSSRCQYPALDVAAGRNVDDNQTMFPFSRL